MEKYDNKEKRTLSVLLLIFVILSAGIVATGYLYYRNYEKHYRTEVERQLSAIAELKVDELVQWRKERSGDAAVFYKNDNFSARVWQYLKTPEDAEAQTRLRTWISQFQAANEYNRVFLLDTKGIERMSVPDTPEPVAPHLLQHFSKILRSGQVTFLDFHRDAPDRPIYLATLVPILDSQDGSRAIGLLVLRIDPQKYLYPFITRWPTPSRTAESLLIRRDGNNALFLNELRFKKNTALNLRSPLGDVKMPTVKAALGQEGIVEGIDYRGVPVIADVCSVPNSPWFLVAKMDVSEVYKPLKEKLWEIVILIGALLICAGAGVGFVWRHQRTRYYREKYEAAESLRESEANLRAVFESARDGILAADVRTRRFVVANEAICRMLGYGCNEMLNLGVEDIHPAEDLLRVQEQIEQQNEGKILLATDIPVKRKDGSVFYADINSTTAELGGRPCLIGVFRDITERKRVEESLRRHAGRLRNLHETDRSILQAIESPEAIAQAAILHLRGLLHCQRSSIGIFDLEKKEVRIFAADVNGETIVQVGKHLSEESYGDLEILRQGRMEIIEDMSKVTSPSAVARILQAEGILSSINIPLLSARGLIGALNIGWEEPRAITPEDMEISREVAGQIAIAIEHAHLLQETKRYAAELEDQVQERTKQLEDANKRT